MAQAQITINAVAGSNDDLPINVLVSLDNVNAGGELTYNWTILDQPPGAADALSSTIVQNPTFTPKKEGTYLIKLVVNQSLPSEVSDTQLVGIRQVKTRQRVPAAGETIQTGSRGWAGAAGQFLQEVDEARADPVLVVGATGAAGLTVGNTVRVTGVTTLKSGLPGQEDVPSFVLADATNINNVNEALGIIESAVDGTGGPYAMGKLVNVRMLGLFQGATGGGAVVGDLVYVSDLGTLALTPGTITRSVGSVAAAGGGTFDCWFSGTGGLDAQLTVVAPVNVTKAAAAVGVSSFAARSDHKHDVNTAAPIATSTANTNQEGSSTSLARADHVHAAQVANVEAFATGTTTTGSVAFVELPGVGIVGVPAGTYLLMADADIENSSASADMQFELRAGTGTFAAAAVITGTTRGVRVSAGGANTNLTIIKQYVVVGPTPENIYIGWNTSTGTAGALHRTLNAIRLL
jgi:hypothetical protein